MLLATHTVPVRKFFGFPVRLMLTTVIPSLTSEVLRFVNLASHSLSTGER